MRGRELVPAAMPELRVRPLGPPRTLATPTVPACIEVQRLLSRASLSATSNHNAHDTGDGRSCQQETIGIATGRRGVAALGTATKERTSNPRHQKPSGRRAPHRTPRAVVEKVPGTFSTA